MCDFVLGFPQVRQSTRRRDGEPFAIAVGIQGAVAQDHETAIFVPPGEAAALAEAISRLLADGALCRRLGAAARRNVEQRFDIRATTDRLLAVYHQLRAEGEARP